MHKALHTRNNIDRLYVPRKEGGRGSTSVEDCVDVAIHGLEKYSKKGEERLIIAASNSNVNLRAKNITTKSKKTKTERKQLYG